MRDAVRRVHATGKIVIAGSANDSPTARVNYPASFAEVIGVGAITADGTVAPCSQPANADVIPTGGYGGSRHDARASLHFWNSIDYGQGTSYARRTLPAPSRCGSTGTVQDRPGPRTVHLAATDISGATADGHGLLNVAALRGAPPYRAHPDAGRPVGRVRQPAGHRARRHRRQRPRVRRPLHRRGRRHPRAATTHVRPGRPRFPRSGRHVPRPTPRGRRRGRTRRGAFESYLALLEQLDPPTNLARDDETLTPRRARKVELCEKSWATACSLVSSRRR